MFFIAVVEAQDTKSLPSKQEVLNEWIIYPIFNALYIRVLVPAMMNIHLISI